MVNIRQGIETERVSIRECLKDLDEMKKTGSWRLPVGFGDYARFFVLGILVRFHWFRSFFNIERLRGVSFPYMILLSYMLRKGLFEVIYERKLHVNGYYSYLLVKTIHLRHRKFIIRGQGVSENRELALSKALGEIVERTMSGLYDLRSIALVDSPAEMMKRSSIIYYPPKHHRFLLVQRERYKELFHDPEKPIEWVEGVDLISRKKAYIPKDIASWCSRLYNRKNSVLVHATTNGAAGFFSRDGAVLRGLLEVLQRDAFLVHWLTMIAPDVIRIETLPEVLKKQIQGFGSLGISVFVLHVTALNIPSIVVVGIHNGRGKEGVTLTAASSMTLEKAISDALHELVVGVEIFYASDGDKGVRLESTEPFVSELDRMTRQFYWLGVQRVAQFRWFVSGRSVSYVESLQYDIECEGDDSSRLKACIRVLGALGEDYHPIAYYPKNGIQEELGFFVAQVYIPKAFPLYLFEGYGTFESERLREFAALKGYDDWRLNPLPHGFP